MAGPDADAIVVGAGLAGLVATAELAAAGRRAILVDQEPEQSLGGQAWWSFGGLFLVDSPEQRRLRIRDSRERAWQDWERTAGFDRAEDAWPRRWAEAYVDFAAGEKRAWLHAKGMRWLPNVGWAERGWNSVPRFHVTWGTGHGVVEPFVREVRASDRVELRCGHRVEALSVAAGAVDGVSGTVVGGGTFELRAPVVVLCSGGIGGNHELVRAAWPERLGTPPARMLSGVPAHVDGRGIQLAQAAGGRVVNADRMWHYVEGIENWAPVWPLHGIRILPGPSSLWLDATGRRLPPPLFPGFDTLGTLAHLRRTGHDHSWFVLTQKIAEKEFALSGSEQNPDITSKSIRAVLKTRVGKGAPGPVAAFLRDGVDFVVERDLRALVDGMNALTDEPLLSYEQVAAEVGARDGEGDPQAIAIRGARTYLADKITRVATPHSLLDPAAGPLIAVRLNVLTRKTLGGLETDLDARVLRADGTPLPGLYAAGEAAGFGGGGMHGYRSLEGTFLGGCIFSGRVAGRAAR